VTVFWRSQSASIRCFWRPFHRPRMSSCVLGRPCVGLQLGYKRIPRFRLAPSRTDGVDRSKVSCPTSGRGGRETGEVCTRCRERRSSSTARRMERCPFSFGSTPCRKRHKISAVRESNVSTVGAVRKVKTRPGSRRAGRSLCRARRASCRCESRAFVRSSYAEGSSLLPRFCIAAGRSASG